MARVDGATAFLSESRTVFLMKMAILLSQIVHIVHIAE